MSLEEAKKYQLHLKEFLTNGCTRSDPIILSPIPTRHPTTRTLEFITLIVSFDPCPICNNYYANHECVVVPYDYVYHPWCIAVHVQLFDTYAKLSCGKHLDHQWCINMGYKLLGAKDQHRLDEQIVSRSTFPTSYIWVFWIHFIMCWNIVCNLIASLCLCLMMHRQIQQVWFLFGVQHLSWTMVPMKSQFYLDKGCLRGGNILQKLIHQTDLIR